MNKKKIKIVNLTPHEITLKGEEVESGDLIASVYPMVIGYKEIGNITVLKIKYMVENLPAPKANTIYIVSPMVLSNVRGRDDVFSFATLETYVHRNSNKRIVEVSALMQRGYKPRYKD